MKISKIITTKSLTVNYDGKTTTVSVNQPEYAELLEALRLEDENRIVAIVDKLRALLKAGNTTTKSTFEVRDGRVYVDGMEVAGVLAKHMLHYLANGLGLQPLINFFKKAQLNPSERARSDLYAFLETNDHPITEDGNFIGYKRVCAADDKGAYLDMHSRTMDNRPGTVLKMPREQVDSNPDVTCSYGLHVANWHYAANQYGNGEGVLMEIEVNPKDVVAIPTDYEQAKIRVCEYLVRRLAVEPEKTKILRSFQTPEKTEELEEEELEEEELEDEGCDCSQCNPQDEESKPVDDFDFDDFIETVILPVWRKTSTIVLTTLKRRIQGTRRARKVLTYRGRDYTAEERNALQEALQKFLKTRTK